MAELSDLNAYVQKAGDTMSGNLDMSTNAIRDIGNLSGSTITRNADNIVSNVGAGTVGNVVVFDNANGKVVADSGDTLANYLPLAGGSMTGDIAMLGHDITGFVNLHGEPLTASNLQCFNLTVGNGTSSFTGPLQANAGFEATTVSADMNFGGNNVLDVNNLAGPTNTRLADNIVSNTGASTNANVAVFSGTTGKVITDGGALALYASSNLSLTRSEVSHSTYNALSGASGSYHAIPSASLTPTNGATYLVLFSGTFSVDIDVMTGGAFYVKLFNNAVAVASTERQVTWSFPTVVGTTSQLLTMAFQTVVTANGTFTVQWQMDASNNPFQGPWNFSMIRLA
jgi:hypothetical protein